MAANSALELLKNEDMQSDKARGTYKYFVSDSAADFAKLGGLFLEKPIGENIEKIDIEEY